MRNRRAVICAALALAVPLPAYALTSGDGDEGPVALAVSASLDSCGIADTQVVCVIDVSFDPIADARRYTASVTRPDGSVIDYGSIGAGGTSLPVTYVGAGTYGVRVSAYGRGWNDKPVLLDSDTANTRPGEDDGDDPGARTTDQFGPTDAEPEDAAAEQAGGSAGDGEGDVGGDDAASETPADCVETPAPTVPPVDSEPPEEPPADEPPAEEPAEAPAEEPSDADESKADKDGAHADETDETTDAAETPAPAPTAAPADCPAP